MTQHDRHGEAISEYDWTGPLGTFCSKECAREYRAEFGIGRGDNLLRKLTPLQYWNAAEKNPEGYYGATCELWLPG